MTSEFNRRRTFAIISHPDAGKTTLTEKLLLAGGAIHLAGDVKARGDRRRARSDWMKIEQERGISVTSSVMTFEHDGLVFNLLDTPGHEDFSEDTYRTLTAVDSAVMVIDAAKGIESQTRKLFEVCRLRDIPIMTFINKVDREGRDPFELLDEIHETLQLDIVPMVWPIGMGGLFHGCYDLPGHRFLTSSPAKGGAFDTSIPCSGYDDARLDAQVPEHVLKPARENLELAEAAYAAFEPDAYRAGNQTPVVFGSALRGYGVETLLKLIGTHAPEPRPSPADVRVVEPREPAVSGFVFKVQAHMDRTHRDRVAFLRICSGRFVRGESARHVRSGKSIRLANSTLLMGQGREEVSEAYPGDVVGLFDPGLFRIGDTLSERGDFSFEDFPVFPPEHFMRVELGLVEKRKALAKGLEQLAQEGAVQVID